MKPTHILWCLVGCLLPVANSLAEEKAKPKFTVGKETTFVEGPIDKDGYIDYAAALNKRLSEGVTPENNANVLIWRALGPRPEGARMPKKFFEWLGIDEPPEKGDYFIGLVELAKQRGDIASDGDTEKIEALEQQLIKATSRRPWTSKEFPIVAAWLEANEKPLALIVEATKRPRYFSPLVVSDRKYGSNGLFKVTLSGVQRCREVAWALTSRAMLRLGEGKRDAAWQDLLVCHRLARFIARGGILIESLVGIAIDTSASDADLMFLDRAELSTDQVKRCLSDLQKLPPLPPVADKVDLGERFFFLDSMMMVMRDGGDALSTTPLDPQGIP